MYVPSYWVVLDCLINRKSTGWQQVGLAGPVDTLLGHEIGDGVRRVRTTRGRPRTEAVIRHAEYEELSEPRYTGSPPDLLE